MMSRQFIGKIQLANNQWKSNLMSQYTWKESVSHSVMSDSLMNDEILFFTYIFQ